MKRFGMRPGLAVSLVVVLTTAFAPLQAQDTSSVEDTLPPPDQINWDAARVQMSRADLTELRERWESIANSAAYSGEMRSRSRGQLALIEARLLDGDFQVGDRIMLRVEGEEALSDSFTVQRGRIVNLGEIGDIPLAGVLRAELPAYMEEQLARFIRNPRVQARSLIRLTVTGGVGAPGFYTLASESMLSDVLMITGGPSTTSDITKIRIERNDERIWEAQALQEAIIEGRTLDQLNLRAGDRIVVPDEGAAGQSGGALRVIQTFSILLALPLTIAALVAIF